MQVVERCLERAAEAVERRLERAARDTRNRPAKARIQQWRGGLCQKWQTGYRNSNQAFFLSVVIPAQAGIQWFNKDIPAYAGMPIKQSRLTCKR